MVSTLYTKHNYTNRSINYIKNTPIIEYDMVNAGINILRKNNYITQEQYDRLNRLPKLEKNIIVGKFLGKNKEINNFLIEEFVNIRKELFELNGIEDNHVLAIKKDAIFLIDKVLTKTKLNEYYSFTVKNKYTSYLNIFNKEYYYDSLNDKLDLKGYSSDIVEFHKDHLFRLTKDLLKYGELNDTDSIFIKLLETKEDLITYNLPKEFYYDIELGGYIIQPYPGMQNIFSLPEIKEEHKTKCAYNNNLSFILNLSNILL